MRRPRNDGVLVAAVILVAAAIVAAWLVFGSGGHEPAGRPDHYPNPTVSVTR